MKKKLFCLFSILLLFSCEVYSLTNSNVESVGTRSLLPARFTSSFDDNTVITKLFLSTYDLNVVNKINSLNPKKIVISYNQNSQLAYFYYYKLKETNNSVSINYIEYTPNSQDKNNYQKVLINIYQ